MNDLIKRIDSLHARTVINYGGIEEIKSVYELIAYNCANRRKGIPEDIFIDILREYIEQLCNENNRKRSYGKLRELLKRSDTEITDAFFTKMSLLKSDGKYVQFLSETFMEHLAANRMIIELKDKEDDKECVKLLNGCRESKYNVFVMLCTLVYDINNTDLIDNVGPKVESLFSGIVNTVLEKKAHNPYDIDKVCAMIIRIFTKQYGENILINRYISEAIFENVEIIRTVLATDTDKKNPGWLRSMEILERATKEKDGLYE